MDKINFVNGSAPALNATNLNQMQTNIEEAIKNTLKLVFPIGSTYTTQTNVNPSTILNFGTWERVKGKVLVGLDEDDEAFNTIGKTGGEKTHTLTIPEIPEHDHIVEKVATFGHSSGVDFGGSGNWQGQSSIKTGKTGGSQPHNILQPYQVIGYMWIRTA